MACLFVHQVPAARNEGGVLVLNFPSGDEVVSIALTRHAAFGLFRELQQAFESFDGGGELVGLQDEGKA